MKPFFFFFSFYKTRPLIDGKSYVSQFLFPFLSTGDLWCFFAMGSHEEKKNLFFKSFSRNCMDLPQWHTSTGQELITEIQVLPLFAGGWGARDHHGAEPRWSHRGPPKELHVWHYLWPRLQTAGCVQQGGQTSCGVCSGGIQWFVLPIANVFFSLFFIVVPSFPHAHPLLTLSIPQIPLPNW